MELKRRPPIVELPSYGLTSDLLSFIRCGLQYRYMRIGKLPPTRPLQLWFGQFIHGVLEEGFRQYDFARRQGEHDLPPWPAERIREILEQIKQRLAAQGLFAWDAALERAGDARARTILNELGPILFPLIHRAEVRLTGARHLRTDLIPPELRVRAVERYEIAGVIDVISHVQLDNPEHQTNQLVDLVLANLPAPPDGDFEVIVDYKGMRRPPHLVNDGAPQSFDVFDWQILTYADLRSRHQDAHPVAAGVIIYLNELQPGTDDLLRLKEELAKDRTDVRPQAGSEVADQLQRWHQGGPLPHLPLEFRVRRAVRVVPVTPAAIPEALTRFDEVVASIETCRGREIISGAVINSWDQNASDQATCAACDHRTYCPDYLATWSSKARAAPTLPAETPKRDAGLRVGSGT